MKNATILKIVVLVFFMTAAFSCSDDDTVLETTNDLIGEWQRSDFDNDFEYKLIFNADNTGYKTEREGSIEDQGISSVNMFNWNTSGRILTINFVGETITTSFSINANGELFLSDLTDLYFIKLE